jgi:folate-binding protein YgfZ
MMSEYDAALTSAALFDCPDAAKLVLTGPDAPMFLGNLSTNDIKNLPLGGGCEAYFCDSRAKVQFQAWIYHVRLAGGQHALWVGTTPGRNAELAQYLDRYLISEQVEIADVTDQFAQLHLAGARAKDILHQALRTNGLGLVEEFYHTEVMFGIRAKASVRRNDALWFPGFDIVVRREWVEDVRQLLISAGATPAGPATYETLRIEAGTPVFGPDIDANRFVMEVGNAARAVSYTKGCFLGQEPIVMARDRAGHVNRAFLGLRVLEGGPLPHGSKLFRDGQEVGVVTSSCHSPRLGLPVALGYIRWKHQDPGTRMEAETPAGRQAVEVVGLPPVR